MSFAVDDSLAPHAFKRGAGGMIIAVAAAGALGAGVYLWQARPKQQAPAEPVALVDVQVLSKPNTASAPAPQQEVAVQPAAVQPDAGEALSAAEPIEPKKPKPPKEWRLRGAVYDLTTLKGISECTLVFTNDATSARFETSTDDSGRYRMILPTLAEGGYTLKIAHPEFNPAFYRSGKPDYRALGKDERLKAAARLAGAVPRPVLLRAESAQPLITDFFLSPTRLPAE